MVPVLGVPSSCPAPRGIRAVPRAAGGPAGHVQAPWQLAERSHTCCLLRLHAALTAPTAVAGSTAGSRCVPQAPPPARGARAHSHPRRGAGTHQDPVPRLHRPGASPPAPRQRHHLPVFFF